MDPLLVLWSLVQRERNAALEITTLSIASFEIFFLIKNRRGPVGQIRTKYCILIPFNLSRGFLKKTSVRNVACIYLVKG